MIPQAEAAGEAPAEGRRGRRSAAWDRPGDLLALADPKGASPRPDPPATSPSGGTRRPLERAGRLGASGAASSLGPLPRDTSRRRVAPEPSVPSARVTPGDPDEIAAPVVAGRAAPKPKPPPDRAVGRLRPELAPPRSPGPPPDAVRTQPPLAALPAPPALVRPDADAPGVPLEARPAMRPPPSRR